MLSHGWILNLEPKFVKGVNGQSSLALNCLAGLVACRCKPGRLAVRLR